jgi:hypothetical protein
VMMLVTIYFVEVTLYGARKYEYEFFKNQRE